MSNLIVTDITYLFFLSDVCRQFDQITAEADQYGNELRTAKGEISELKRLIARLQNEIQAAQAQVSERCRVLD